MLSPDLFTLPTWRWQPAADPLRARLASALLAGRTPLAQAWYASQFDPDRLRRFDILGVEECDRAELEARFLGPMLRLLAAFVETGEPRYRDVYLDERLRYAPHRASPEVRCAFFEEVLALDERALLEAVASEGPRASEALRRLLAELHAPLREAPSGKPVRVLALGDCLMNEVRVSLAARCRAERLPLDFRMLYFSAALGKSLSAQAASEFLQEFPADLVALSFLTFKGIAPYTALMREADSLTSAEVERRCGQLVGLIGEFLGQLREHTDAPFLLHNASGLPLTTLRRKLPVLPAQSQGSQRVLTMLNAALAELVRHTPRTLLLDEAGVARARGLRACEAPLIPAGVASGAMFHTGRLGEFLAEPYLDVVRSYRELAKAKVLLVDFDNTLWEGVMAEGPVRHRDALQRLLRRLKEGGLLLVSVSKNDPASIRWGELALGREDFVLHKVSWNLKVQSIQEAAQELDLGLDAFVLLDDNPVERELVRTQLPAVRTLDPLEPRTEAWLERVLQFPNTRQTEEARARTELYRQQVKRREALQGKFDYPTMMASLGLQVRFARAGRGDLDRVAELVQRTNQFNTTTRRYSRPELQALFASAGHGVYVATLADKFGSVGLVAVAVVARAGGERVIESFVMSCRAMGFELERWMLRAVLDAEAAPGARFVGRYLPTDRNTPCRDLFHANGFSPCSPTEWELQPDAPRPERPAWFAQAP